MILLEFIPKYSDVNGCDSSVVLDLIINNSTDNHITISTCDSLLWNGLTYFASGSYSYTTINSVGCDSTVNLNLTVNYSTTNSSTATSCDNYNWRGNTYYISGTYYDTTLNINN